MKNVGAMKGSMVCIRSYATLLKTNRQYRLYLISHICQHAGDWFVHVASLITIERLLPGSSKAISMLVAMKMIPFVLFVPLGGVLADTFDKRVLMITLDLLAAISVLGFIAALSTHSILMFYVVCFVRYSIVAMYEPITRSMVPFLVTQEEDLQRAMTVNGLAWSTMLLFGALVAGHAAATVGVQACFVIDTATYILSAVVMSNVRGSFCVSDDSKSISETKKPLLLTTRIASFSSFSRKIVELTKYLFSCGFGPLVFLKSSGALTWGASDVLNVSISHIDGDEVASSKRLGMMYSSVGLGCIIGPILSNCFTDIKKPETLQLACIVAISFLISGWLGLANVNNFTAICMFCSIRTIGSSIIWINSSLLLQKLVSEDLLGRVLGFEFASAMCCETIAGFVAGFLEDAGFNKHEISLAEVTVGVISFLIWFTYHICGRGAANELLLKESDRSNEQEIEALHVPVV